MDLAADEYVSTDGQGGLGQHNNTLSSFPSHLGVVLDLGFGPAGAYGEDDLVLEVESDHVTSRAGGEDLPTKSLTKLQVHHSR